MRIIEDYRVVLQIQEQGVEVQPFAAVQAYREEDIKFAERHHQEQLAWQRSESDARELQRNRDRSERDANAAADAARNAAKDANREIEVAARRAPEDAWKLSVGKT